MAKRKSSSSNTWGYDRLAGLFALIALFIAGTCYMINLCLKIFGGHATFGVLTLIANIFMLVAIVMVSWKSLRKAHLPNKTVWYVIYWIFVIMAAAGLYTLL